MKAVLSNYASKCFFATLARLKQSGKFIGKHGLSFIGWLWNYFTTRTMDVQIAIVLSIFSAIAMQIATLWTIAMFTALAIFAWLIVWREYTKPVAIALWAATKPFRTLVWRLISFRFGAPMAMITYGMISFALFAMTFYISKEVSAMFGMAGFGGIIFGMFFYAVQLHSKGKTRRNQ